MKQPDEARTRWRLLVPLSRYGWLCAAVLVLTWGCHSRNGSTDNRQEVVFWHFWGGADREVVDRIVAQFNSSQSTYQVRAVAMPGNNLDLKLFLAVTGGDPPDLVNQDDPIVADWAARGAILPLDEIAPPDEMAGLEDWLLPAARRMGTYQGKRYALCNGLDIRALYFNKTMLDAAGFAPPLSLDDLDAIAMATTERDPLGQPTRIGFLPDPRRLWAWGTVFGGDFFDEESRKVTANSQPIVAALEWMTKYRRIFGVDEVAAYRQGDQSLPGKAFPLLAGRYAMIMDGQWRVRDIRASQQAQRERGEIPTEYGVCSLPPPPEGRQRAGWVNGNFFLVPRGARNGQGAWEFMKFWSGFAGHASTAAEICVEGGWIPVSDEVVQQPLFQKHLADEPLFDAFVKLAASAGQVPTPVIVGAGYFQRAVNNAAEAGMYVEPAASAQELLDGVSSDVQSHLDSLTRSLDAK